MHDASYLSIARSFLVSSARSTTIEETRTSRHDLVITPAIVAAVFLSREPSFYVSHTRAQLAHQHITPVTVNITTRSGMPPFARGITSLRGNGERVVGHREENMRVFHWRKTRRFSSRIPLLKESKSLSRQRSLDRVTEPRSHVLRLRMKALVSYSKRINALLRLSPACRGNLSSSFIASSCVSRVASHVEKKGHIAK